MVSYCQQYISFYGHTYYLQVHGRQMVKMLVRHGANLEYVDHALRNALYWSVYNCCSEISMFLLDCGAKVIYFVFIFISSFLKSIIFGYSID